MGGAGEGECVWRGRSGVCVVGVWRGRGGVCVWRGGEEVLCHGCCCRSQLSYDVHCVTSSFSQGLCLVTVTTSLGWACSLIPTATTMESTMYVRGVTGGGDHNGEHDVRKRNDGGLLSRTSP